MIRTVVLALGAWLSAAALEPAGRANDAQPAGVQQCDTKCQTSFTDCMLACDGEPKCQEQCRGKVEQCVVECKTPKAPAPAPSKAPAPAPAPVPAPPAPKRA